MTTWAASSALKWGCTWRDGGRAMVEERDGCRVADGWVADGTKSRWEENKSRTWCYVSGLDHVTLRVLYLR